MKLLLDENIPAALGHALEAAGFQVRRVADLTPRARDDAVLSGAERDAEIVVTADKDFGELVYHRQQAFLGVVLIRSHPIGDHVDRVVQALIDHRDELVGAFVVIDARKVRVRRRPTQG